MFAIFGVIFAYQNNSLSKTNSRVNTISSEYNSLNNKVQFVFNAMPKEYVQLERYKADQKRFFDLLDKIDSKLDKLVMKK